jgi:hypothetical protein
MAQIASPNPMAMVSPAWCIQVSRRGDVRAVWAFLFGGITGAIIASSMNKP